MSKGFLKDMFGRLLGGSPAPAPAQAAPPPPPAPAAASAPSGAGPSDNDVAALVDAAARGDTLAITTYIIDWGRQAIDLPSVDNKLTALLSAARAGQIEAVDLLLDEGAKIDYCDPVMRATALRLSIAFGHPDMAARLVAAGANTDIADGDGNTPLMIAASMADVKSAEMLLKHNPDLEARNAKGQTALDIARHADFPPLERGNWQKIADLIDKAAVENRAALSSAAQEFERGLDKAINVSKPVRFKV